MNYLYILDSLNSVFKSITFFDIADILIMSWLIYKGGKLVKETRAEQLIKGIVILIVGYACVKIAKLKTLSFLLDNFFQVGIIAIIIMFQPELRRILEKMGRAKVGTISIATIDSADTLTRWQYAVPIIADACSKLSLTATGALIVLERKTKLGEQIDTGTLINAIPSSELLCNIFFHNSPLHDGAVIIRDGMIYAAACFLPKPQKEELVSKQLGSRHRAAIGMSENSDAIVIAVSEETGVISVAENGQLSRGITKDSLEKLLISNFLPEKLEDKTKINKKTRKEKRANKRRNKEVK